MDSEKDNKQRRHTMHELFKLIMDLRIETEVKNDMLMKLADESSKAMERLKVRIVALEQKQGHSIRSLLVNQHETPEQTAKRLIDDFIKSNPNG